MNLTLPGWMGYFGGVFKVHQGFSPASLTSLSDNSKAPGTRVSRGGSGTVRLVPPTCLGRGCGEAPRRNHQKRPHVDVCCVEKARSPLQAGGPVGAGSFGTPTRDYRAAEPVGLSGPWGPKPLPCPPRSPGQGKRWTDRHHCEGEAFPLLPRW